MQILQWTQEGCGRRLKTLHYCMIWCALHCIKDINCHLLSHYYVKIELGIGNRLSEFFAPGLFLNMFRLLFSKIPLYLLFIILNSFLPGALLMISKIIHQKYLHQKLNSWIISVVMRRFSVYILTYFLHVWLFCPNAGRLCQKHLSFWFWHIVIRHMMPVTKRQCWVFDVILMKTSPFPSSPGVWRTRETQSYDRL